MVTSIDDAEPAPVLSKTDAKSAKEVNHPATIHDLPAPRYNSGWRLGRLLSIVVPPLLGFFILYGWLFASEYIREAFFHLTLSILVYLKVILIITTCSVTVPYVCATHSTAICKNYAYAFHFLVGTTFTFFLFLWLLPNSHSQPPSSLPRAIQCRLVAHEVITEDGGYPQCWQDSCQGRVIPPRARHCKDCRQCRLEFDHHCPWLGCISRDTYKAFILFLGFATLAILAGLAPVYSLAWRQFRHVMHTMEKQTITYEKWWDKSLPWIGGPVYWYIGGVLVSYYHYNPEMSTLTTTQSSQQAPVSFILLLYSVLGSILAIFCSVLFVAANRDVAIASSTIEAARFSIRVHLGANRKESSKFIQMPITLEGQGNKGEDNGQLQIRAIPASLNLYNFGKRTNYARLFGRSLREILCKFPPIVPPRVLDSSYLFISLLSNATSAFSPSSLACTVSASS